jgi:hypothetical protein
VAELSYALGCPRCPYFAEVSEVDPDATLSEMWDHLFSKHADYDRTLVSVLLAEVEELTQAEAVSR